MVFDPYASGVLVPEVHASLVKDLDNFAKDAGVAKTWLCKPLADTCGSDEVDYVRKFNTYRASAELNGLCLVSEKSSTEQRMAAIAGALVRNFIRARVMTLGAVLDAVGTRENIEATCLLIPNFFVPKAQGGTLAAWQVNALHDLLIHRSVRGEQTVIGVSSLELMRKEYGVGFGSIVDGSYRVVILED